MAEHTVGLILNLTHRINESDRFVRKGEFHGFQFDLFVGDEIKNNTIGIVGLGNIGKDLAKILKNGFGCKICYY
ncbi:MAG: NAD(P)-dependent oxidoreductase, partial [Candidatus Pacebacteria bacterium]|nr:NAD(P)-dependent oxidoreductase [Candidatus Paceibacterota bacterium]